MTSSLTVVSRAALALTGVLLPTWAAATHLPAPPPPLARVDPPLGPSRPDVYGDPLPAGAVSRMGTVRLRHGGVITHVAFAPDGKTLYSASPEDKFVRAWEVPAGKELHRFGPRGPVWCVAVVADGGRLVTAENDDVLRAWDAKNGQELAPLADVSPTAKNIPRDAMGLSTVPCARASRDGKTLVTAQAKDNTLIIWDAVAGKELRRIPGSAVSTHALDLSADGSTLVAANGHTIGVWEVATGKQVRQLQGHEQAIVAVALSPDGKVAASFAHDQTLRWWDVANGKELDKLQHQTLQAALALSPDGKTLAFATGDGHEGRGAVTLIDVATREKRLELDDMLPGVTALAFAPDGKTLATGSGGGNGIAGAVRLWDVATGKELHRRAAHPGAVTTIAVSPDGRLVASCSTSERVVRLWDVATGRELRRLEGHEAGVDEVQFSPDGRLIASAAWHQPVILWDVQTGRTVARLADHTSLGPHMRFSADGKTLATAGDQGTAGVWDVTTGKLVQQFALPPDGVSAVLAAGGGKLLAYAPAESENGEEAVITVWDLVAGRIIRRFNGHTTMVNGAALSADGRMLASRSEDRTIRVWEAATGAERVRFADRGQGSGWTGTQFLAFAPDGRTLATCGPADSVVRLWDLTTGTPLPPLTGHLGWVGAVEFSTDGRTLISGSQDSSILAWDVTALARREGRAERRMSADEARKKWDELREPDAARAYRATWDLVAAGDSAVEFLRGQLHPASAVDPQQLARWIRDLDHPQYAARERATAALALVADQAESALRVALVRTTSAEVRQRIRRILDTESEVEPSPDRLREARAVEALELSASPAARRFLTHLAEGAPEATLTRDAAASLKRLQARRGPENADR